MNVNPVNVRVSPGCWRQQIVLPPVVPMAAGSSIWLPAPAPSPNAVSPPESVTSANAQKMIHKELDYGEMRHCAISLPY